MSQVVMDRGPVADQLNLAAAGVAVNNVSLTTVLVTGPVLLIATACITGGAAAQVVEIRIRRNGAALAHGAARANAAIALITELTAVAVVPDAAVGDVFDILALGGAGADQDLLINDAQLVMIGLPHGSAIAPQATATA